MSDLWKMTVISGVCFGVWPLMIQKSKLEGNLSVLLVCIVSLAFTIPLTVKTFRVSINNAEVVWMLAIVAAVIAWIGLILFNGMLGRATQEEVGAFFFVNLLIQVSVSTGYKVYLARSLSPSRAIGFIAAVIATYAFTRT